jgi:hypothetical protein
MRRLMVDSFDAMLKCRSPHRDHNDDGNVRAGEGAWKVLFKTYLQKPDLRLVPFDLLQQQPYLKIFLFYFQMRG